MDAANDAANNRPPDYVPDYVLDGILDRGAMSAQEVGEFVQSLRELQGRHRASAAAVKRKLSRAVVLMRRLLAIHASEVDDDGSDTLEDILGDVCGCLDVLAEGVGLLGDVEDARGEPRDRDEPGTAESLADWLLHEVWRTLDRERMRYHTGRLWRAAVQRRPLAAPGAQ